MWKELQTEQDLQRFMEEMSHFHDACIKELKYVSGAYVNPNLGMHPLNDQRALRVVLQRQFRNVPMVELEFRGLKLLRLQPIDEVYTCEILDSTLRMQNGFIYWCDGGDIADFESYNGTLICASSLRWRPIENRMGSEEYYHSPI